MSKKSTKNTSQLKFYQKLILNQFLLKEFGVESFIELADALKSPTLEHIDEEGVTGYHKELLLKFNTKSIVSKEKLALYDYNIVSHLRTINLKRDTAISLKYFQYLTLLFIEFYLDEYFNNKDSFLERLNEYLEEFNAEYPQDKINEFKAEDLNKLAIWNATGSGKTLLMHINYLQYRHYSDKNNTDENYILLTPKESLSAQHLDEFKISGIHAAIYNKNLSKAFSTKTNSIQIIENSKFADKDGEKTVAISRFGNKNILFVDEGHRGASGDIWFKYRNELCEEGFSFEYSATFGQAVGKDKKLLQEYAKCIIFDYSYKYFYNDGYGKDYFIVNLEHNSESDSRNIYLTASLLTYYQQKKLYTENKSEVKDFNLSNPLFVFVGSSVNAIRTEGKKSISDVVDILLFFKEFAIDEARFTSYIERILKGTTGLIDAKNRDIFINSFNFVDKNASKVYEDILKLVFNSSSKSSLLHIEDLKGVDGEIQVKLGDNEPFALINVGDTAKLLKLCEDNSFNVSSISFSTSLFQQINDDNSSINLLIGSKKFSEGWNSYRVSTMGLMNIGRSEGSEIIQLFGRGVRLRGYNFSLKRSNFIVQENRSLKIPKYLQTLETLSIFGLKADYMSAFKDMLEEEGVPSTKEMPYIISLPVIRNKEYTKAKIMTLSIKNGYDYKKHAPKPFLRYKDGILVELDCYSKVQFETSTSKSQNELTKNSSTFKEEHLLLLDYEELFFDLQKYKNEKARYNVNICMQDIITLLKNEEWYNLLIPESELEIRTIQDCKKFQSIAFTLLCKYFDKLYYVEKSTWEKPLLELIEMVNNDTNFLDNDEYTISINNTDENEWAKIFIEDIAKKVEEAITNGKMPELEEIKNDIGAIGFSSLMYSPFLYVASKNKEITVAPVALNDSEHKFIKDLNAYISQNSQYFIDKELYIIRNKSKKGIGFFEGNGFYPDFIMWVVDNGKQYMSFIDPHGMRNTAFTDPKVELYTKIKEIESSLGNKVILNSFILSPTDYNELSDKTHTKLEWNNKHVLFMKDTNYIETIFSHFSK